MFFFPFSTDAPVYYWPFATVGLIVANIAVFVAMVTGDISTPENWILLYGNGLHPEQWLTSIFTHGSIDHLLGNMLFLWVFGLVVEGKLGWWKFLTSYFVIGVGQSMSEQIAMLSASGASLGASAAIFGLMAMATVWAPKNEITFGYWVVMRIGTFDVSILALSAFYVCMEIFFLILSGGTSGSSWLHLSGAAFGAPLAIVMLKRGIVDCEGWDLFHVWKGDYAGFREEPDPQATFDEVNQRQQRSDQNLLTDAKRQIRQFLQQGNVRAAVKLCDKMRDVSGGLVLERDELSTIIRGLHQQRCWTESAPFMAELIERVPNQADTIRLKLAQICVVELDRPGKALDLLAEVDRSRLSDMQSLLAKRIEAKALAMQAEGVVEFDTDQW